MACYIKREALKFTVTAVAASVITLTGCASSPHPGEEPDAICSEVADFANSSADGLVHQVQLSNDWGGVFCQSDAEGEVAFACKACTHDSYAGNHLCKYLMQHTSTEFSEINFLRVLRCLDSRYQGLEPGAEIGDLTNKEIWSTHARSTKRGISVGVEYLPGGSKDLPTLIILAQRRQAS
jgi:outer membrane murein-binding lipoprotein Lpp